ncbi:deferrochelatase/peroxidase EfeB [Rubrobacter marinus]|uniref:Deferrochelatase n=1 Tax=Rubrobacter marinus TaxID=2653852 RepID=A0A6G8PY78_9ACTN|nr:iron uptake transporter deferrochelatase/peroxidase subunit [Rubrobacter marinus]QIN79156.1 deferrochelatase/peroxidase EfeB [Rubrobacter marinus]
MSREERPEQERGASGPLDGPRGKRLSRREAFRLAGAAGTGLALGAGGMGVAARGSRAEEASPDAEAVPFYGAHQAGIATPSQHRLHFTAFDVVTEDRDELRDLLREWSEAAALMCAGEPVGDVGGAGFSPYLPPDDTGEAIGHPASRLTITFGFGPTLFERDGEDRFGLAARRPKALAPIPPMPGDALRPELSGGDLCVQACADDPQVAFHAVRNLARIGRGVVEMRWSQMGFGRTSSTSRQQETGRNLFGFKDGTNNLKAEDERAMDRNVWVGLSEGPGWMEGGTYLVSRRIRMLIEVWDRSSLDDQEKTFGRHKVSGAPIGREGEFDAVDLEAEGEDGEPLVPENSHVRLGAEGGESILRRSYSYTDGIDRERGQLDAGLFFVCFQRDPGRQFVPMQRRMAENDALNEYISHTGSAVFALPPGAREGGYVGEGLFAGA